MGQGWASLKFYTYGRKHFTRTGWEQASSKYSKPDYLETMDLSGKNFVVTGANSGLGFELTSILAGKKGRVLMICRNAERGNKARQEIAHKNGIDSNEIDERLPLILGDCGVEDDVRKMVQEINSKIDKLDALICNAGALLPKRTVTRDGKREVTFSTHLVCGTYLLADLLAPLLEKSGNGRLVAVTSGGMYTSKFSWSYGASIDPNDAYNGQVAYSVAKRGQVMLCEYWANNHPLKDKVKFVTAHPGWTDTPGVDEAFGKNGKKWLEPLRSLYQGTEGIAWLCAVPLSEIESGQLYLDRAVQSKHLSSYTQQGPEETEKMMQKLEAEFKQS